MDITSIGLIMLIASLFGLQFVWGYFKFKFIPWLLPIMIAGLFFYTVFTGQVKGLVDVLRPLLALMMTLGLFGSGMEYRDKREARKLSDQLTK